MLAHHLKRLATPVRYAMDPAHEQAIRNYLAIASRAMQVPTLLQNRQFTHMMGDDARLGGELGSTMLEQHDPASLAALIDLMSDRGITPYSRHSNTGSLVLPLLQQLHHNIAGYGQGQAGAHPAVLRGYGDASLDAGNTRQMVRRSVVTPSSGHGNRLWSLLYNLGEYGPPEHREHIQQGLSALTAGDARSIAPLHDRLAGMTGTSATTAQGDLHRALSGMIHPALWHLGEHGALPQ